MKKVLVLFLILALFSLCNLSAQQGAVRVTDANTPLHALQPDYSVPYGPPEKDAVTSVLNRILNYLDASTPPVMIDSKTNRKYEDNSTLSQDAIFLHGVFLSNYYSFFFP